MAEPIKISTKQYVKNGKVEVDGRIWSVKLPGAGTELRFSQASRTCKRLAARIELLDKKIDNSTATEADLDQYDEVSKEYEKAEMVIYDILRSTFKDDTPDNSEVNSWIDETPTAIITLAFEDLRKQSDGGQDAGQPDTPAST